MSNCVREFDPVAPRVLKLFVTDLPPFSKSVTNRIQVIATALDFESLQPLGITDRRV